MAVDNKYGRVSFEEPNTIGEDEPVVVFRAADPLLISLLDEYYRLCETAGTPERHLDLIEDGSAKISAWQRINPGKVRELPTSSNWDGRARIS